MNFSSHQKELIENIGSTLLRGKVELCSGYNSILESAGSLYKTKDFEFWIQQIQETPVAEIPVTNLGHRAACNIAAGLHEKNRHYVQAKLLSISENLFTYSNENEICPAQCEYHYYYDSISDSIFKESELEFLEGIEHGADICRRIAKISELDINAEELYQ